jgi:hypothetical protein
MSSGMRRPREEVGLDRANAPRSATETPREPRGLPAVRRVYTALAARGHTPLGAGGGGACCKQVSAHRDRNGLTFPTSSAEQVLRQDDPLTCLHGAWLAEPEIGPTDIRAASGRDALRRPGADGGDFRTRLKGLLSV